jgi:hypothetical protein
MKRKKCRECSLGDPVVVKTGHDLYDVSWKCLECGKVGEEYAIRLTEKGKLSGVCDAASLAFALKMMVLAVRDNDQYAYYSGN